MPTTYTVLLRLVLRHEYFADNVLRALTIVPTPASAERLRRAGWLLKAQEDGFALLVPGLGNAPALSGAPSPLPLQFHLQPREADFFLYTDLPLTPDTDLAGTQLAGGLFTYSFSLPLKATSPSPADVLASAANQLPLRPLKFAYILPDRQAAELRPVPAGPTAPALGHYPAGTRRVQVDVSNSGSGRYELRSETGTYGFYADDYLSAARAWGLLELTDQVLTGPPGATYTLRFAARPVYWQYQVRGPLPPSPAVLTIVGDTAGLDFESVAPAVGASACFRARNAVRLAHHNTLPPLHLAVQYPGSDKKTLRIIPPQLPLGQVRGLKKIKIKNNFCFIAEIHVKLGP